MQKEVRMAHMMRVSPSRASRAHGMWAALNGARHDGMLRVTCPRGTCVCARRRAQVQEMRLQQMQRSRTQEEEKLAHMQREIAQQEVCRAAVV